MSITPNSRVVTPLKALWRWLVAQPGQIDHHAHDPIMSAGTRAGTSCRQVIRSQPSSVNYVTSRRPVRVLQVMDAGQAPSQVGRMRISGRMADVCAELDRLAAHEARLLH